MTHATTAAQSVQPIPEGYHAITPGLTVRNAAQAIDFYTRVFGATELGRMPAADGQHIMHAELRIGDSRLMLSDEFPNPDWPRSPESLGGSPISLHLYVADADATVARAVAAGATVTQPLENAFWGDRYGKIKDPFGHEWGIATHIEDLSEEEMQRRAQAVMSSSG